MFVLPFQEKLHFQFPYLTDISSMLLVMLSVLAASRRIFFKLFTPFLINTLRMTSVNKRHLNQCCGASPDGCKLQRIKCLEATKKPQRADQMRAFCSERLGLFRQVLVHQMIPRGSLSSLYLLRSAENPCLSLSNCVLPFLSSYLASEREKRRTHNGRLLSRSFQKGVKMHRQRKWY